MENKKKNKEKQNINNNPQLEQKRKEQKEGLTRKKATVSCK